jgi:hypothetical protein
LLAETAPQRPGFLTRIVSRGNLFGLQSADQFRPAPTPRRRPAIPSESSSASTATPHSSSTKAIVEFMRDGTPLRSPIHYWLRFMTISQRDKTTSTAIELYFAIGNCPSTPSSPPPNETTTAPPALDLVRYCASPAKPSKAGPVRQRRHQHAWRSGTLLPPASFVTPPFPDDLRPAPSAGQPAPACSSTSPGDHCGLIEPHHAGEITEQDSPVSQRLHGRSLAG